MTTITLSSKYQVVIPKEVRKQLNLRPGQKLQITKTASGDITIKTASVIDEMYGSMKGKWGTDSNAYLKELRDEWDEPRP